MSRPLQNDELRKVAVLAEADRRTVQKFLAGSPVMSTTANRIKRALIALGFRTECDEPRPVVTPITAAAKGDLFVILNEDRKVLVCVVEPLRDQAEKIRLRRFRPTASHADKKWSPVHALPVAWLQLVDPDRDRILLTEAAKFPSPLGARVEVRA